MRFRLAKTTKKNFRLRMTPEYIVPNCFRGHQELIALQSTRKGGASNGVYSSLNLGSNTGDRRDLVYENTRRLCVAAGINPGQLVSSDQVHGTEILYAEKPGRYHGYDSLVTDKNNLFLCIFTADAQYYSFSFIRPLYNSMRSRARDCSVYHGLKCPYLQVSHLHNFIF